MARETRSSAIASDDRLARFRGRIIALNHFGQTTQSSRIADISPWGGNVNRYDVYILASRSGVLYIGMTSDLTTRIQQHKLKLFPGFTAQYSVSRLVWHEAFTNANEATECERRLKGWRRSKKVALIEASNPTWRDLSDDWEPTPHASGVGRFPSGGRDSQPSADSHR